MSTQRMHERIRELVNEATSVVEGWSDENGTTRYYEFNKEKFAELIIQECVFAVENHGGMCGVTSSKKIKEHFGVKE